MTWYLIENNEGQRTSRGEFETKEEAEKVKADLVTQDPAYADVLYVLRHGAEPAPQAPPSLGHGNLSRKSQQLRTGVHESVRESRSPRR